MNTERANLYDYEVSRIYRAFNSLGTPRALNRFVNTYRLVRSLVPDQEADRFFDPEDGDYRYVILLLAILVGFPRDAEGVFGALSEAKPGDAWRVTIDTAVTGKERTRNLAALGDAMALGATWDYEVIGRWVPRVARYSFRGFHRTG